MTKSSLLLLILGILLFSCQGDKITDTYRIQHVNGMVEIDGSHAWLSHEHILVDFIGADKINIDFWNKDEVSEHILPFLDSFNDMSFQLVKSSDWK